MKNKIELNLLLVDLNTQNVILKGRVSGEYKEIHLLINKLSLDFIKQRNLPINERSLANIKFSPTDSISATEHFYRAIDSYDQGEYSIAFSHFYSASKQDPNFWESFLWMGRMLEFLEMDTLAISAYLSLYKQASQQTEGHDALLFAAILMEKNKTAVAIDAYKTLSDLKPAIPHSFEAAFRLGKLYQQDKKYLESYRSFSQLDKYFTKEKLLEKSRLGSQSQSFPWLDKVKSSTKSSLKEIYSKINNYFNKEEKIPSTTKKERRSRFFRWFNVLGLSRDAIIHMISLYPKLTNLPKDKLLEPPRGLIIVNKDNPEFKETRYGDTQSIFIEPVVNEKWREKFYVISIPDGYVATGIDMQIKGHLTASNNNFDFTMRISPFPLPRNYHNTWLGVIYGQTRKPTSLKKYIPFYGKNQKLLTLQFIENSSEINNWQFRLHLQAEDNISDSKESLVSSLLDTVFYEGQLLGQRTLNEKSFSGIAQPLAKYWYAARQTISLVNNYQDGLFMIFVKGELGGEQTDLMFTHSPQGKKWTTPIRLPLNSLSEDFSPKLIRAEDGILQLFWISNRRGLGWEIWTSHFETKTNSWALPSRIPVERFAVASSGKINYQANNLLHYAVTQDKRGRWIIAFRSYDKDETIFISSQDNKEWELISKQVSYINFYNPVLLEDKAGMFRWAAIGTDNRLHLWSSTNLKQWNERSYTLGRNRHAESFAMHPIHLFSETTDQLLLVLSDASYGMQYARFNPDTSKPKLDLVKDIGLEAYTISEVANNRYLVAQRKNDQIELRQFEKFQTQSADTNSPNSMIYSETMQDTTGNEWTRIYARMRVIQPDVTTVAVEPDGRVWWGIETGIMALKEDDFYMADVTDGFFHHYVTDIVPCDGKVFFASRDLDKLILGSATRNQRSYKLNSKQISKEANSITAIQCGQNNTLYLGTDHGKLFSFNSGKAKLIDTLKDEKITAVIDSNDSRQLWIGTEKGNIYRLDNKREPLSFPNNIKGKVLSLATDIQGILWTSIEGHGAFRYIENNWKKVSDKANKLSSLYNSISIIKADPKQGVWMMPDSKERSFGVIYSDGINSTLLNSPDKKIIAPTGLAINAEGHAWIGTAFDGLFKLQRQRQ